MLYRTFGIKETEEIPNLLQLKRTKCGHRFAATIALVRPSTTPCDPSHLRATITAVVDFPCMRPACGGNHDSFLPCKRKCSLARPSRLLWYNFLACKRKLLSINQIKSNKKLFSSRGYDFPSCKTTEHDYLPRCGGGRAAGWWEVAVHWPQLARGQSRPRSRRPGASKRPISQGRLLPGRALRWSLLIPPAFCRNGHTWWCRWRVRDLEAFACPCRTPRSSMLSIGWWRSLKSVIVSVQTSVKIQSTLIIFFSIFVWCLICRCTMASHWAGWCWGRWWGRRWWGSYTIDIFYLIFAWLDCHV